MDGQIILGRECGVGKKGKVKRVDIGLDTVSHAIPFQGT
jgi:hypothetical protein